MQIHLIVVEAHNHALEHIHYVLRQRERKRNKDKTNSHSSSWTMLHFDSHPDLAVPNVTAKACFLPRNEYSYKVVSRDASKLADIGTDERIESKNLYEKLDTSTGGIAEWILPLVLAADLNSIYWIKNSWCHQFQNGEYRFSVGAWKDQQQNHNFTTDTFLDLDDKATIKVSLMHPYYLDDDTSVEESELHLKKPLHLIVSDSSESMVMDHVQDWILDVCLDYFLCRNPFLDELTSHFGSYFTGLLLRSITTTQLWRNSMMYDNIVAASIYRNHHQNFRQLSKKMIETCVIRKIESNEKVNSIHGIFSSQDEDAFFHLYLSPKDAKDLWNDIMVEISRFILEDKSMSPDMILSIICNALPNLNLPHDDTYSTDASSYECLSLRCANKVKGFGDYLRSFRPKNDPMCITIARSSDDGFTPSHIVDQLQHSVIDEVHSIFCGCSLRYSSEGGVCNLEVLSDYGEFEGSTLEDKRTF